MRYAALFTIELVHDYFSVSTPDVLSIVPAPETDVLLRGMGLIPKFMGNKLYVLARHEADDQPAADIRGDFVLRFHLLIHNPEFQHITNYQASEPYSRKLFFSNTPSVQDSQDKTVDNIQYLHARLPQFDGTKEYHYNDLVRSGSMTAYECLKKIPAGSGNLNNSAQFRNLGKVSYASPSTELLFCGITKIQPLETPAAEVTIQYYAYNSASGSYDLLVKEFILPADTGPSSQPYEDVTLDFRKDGEPLPEGVYRITVNAEEQYLYFRPANDWTYNLGLIAIHHDDQVISDAYRILQPDGTFYMKAPANTEVDTRNFVIRFAPAQYLLSYRCRTNKVTDIQDEAGVIEFDSLAGNTFRSKLPVRMNEQAIDTIAVTYNGSDTLKKTKVPGRQILSITDDENRYIVSETYLNL